MKKRSLNTRLYLMYFIALVPLLLFGLYKNGILLYKKGLVDGITSLKVPIVIAMGIIGAFLGALLREKKKGKTVDVGILNKCKVDVLEAILVVAILPLKSSPIVVFLVTFIFSIFHKKISINRIALMYIVIEGINVLFGLNTFTNAYELSTAANYDGIDLFFGLGSGGICSTSILLILLALLFLSFCKLYKREVAYSSLLAFLALSIGSFMILGKYTEIFPLIFGYNIFFSLVFIAPNLYSSSYTVKGQIMSGILIGILTFIISFFAPYAAVILAIAFVSLINGIIDRIFVIK